MIDSLQGRIGSKCLVCTQGVYTFKWLAYWKLGFGSIFRSTANCNPAHPIPEDNLDSLQSIYLKDHVVFILVYELGGATVYVIYTCSQCTIYSRVQNYIIST